jgi:hypothetical protein
MSTKIQLLPGEQVVMTSDKDILTLTTKRVRYDSEITGASSFISITLDSVASCGAITRSYPILLALAAVAAIAAIVKHDDSQMMMMLFVIAAVLAIIYYASRRAVISIASKGGDTITLPAKGMSRASIIDFIEAIEREKLK